MLALVFKEIRTLLSSLIAYITISAFLLVTGLLLFVANSGYNIFDRGIASLYNFFSLAPFVFLLLIPALTMRSFSEEKSNGTLELLLTKPIGEFKIILAKFIACLLVVLLSILPTLTYYWAIKSLLADNSLIDFGELKGAYLGLFLLGASYCAIGIFASSLTKNQVVSFILSAGICLFFYLGFDGLGMLFSSDESFVMELGMNYHYQSMSKGLLDTRDLVYFISLILFFLILNRVQMASRNWR